MTPKNFTGRLPVRAGISLAAGFVIAALDSFAVNWDSTVVTMFMMFLATAAFGAVWGRRAHGPCR